ncbi:hypothetical protein LINGRAHAP2_LOCUS30795 [Linum grandiflorum]
MPSFCCNTRNHVAASGKLLYLILTTKRTVLSTTWPIGATISVSAFMILSHQIGVCPTVIIMIALVFCSLERYRF